MSKKLVVVLGMHRSGTSVLTKAVSELGYYVGETLPAAEENIKGFYENKDIVYLNDIILSELQLDWKTCDLTYINRCKTFLPLLLDKYIDRATEIVNMLFSSSNRCVIKDPRISILMPFWECVFNKLNIEYKYVLAIRNPAEVSKSFVARKNGTYDEGIKLWVYYNSLILKNLKHQVLVINYKNLLNSTREIISNLCEWLDINESDFNKEIETFANDFVDKDLRHHDEQLYNHDSLVCDMYYFLDCKFLNYTDIRNFCRSNEETIDIYLNNSVKIYEQNFCQVFYDLGEGFKEANSFKIAHEDLFEQSLNISLEENEFIKNIRIDPSDNECIFILNSITNIDTGKPLVISTSNAIYNNDNIYFLPRDGQVYINDINLNINVLNIKFNCLVLDKISAVSCKKIASDDLLLNIISENNKNIKDKDVHISNIEKILCEKDFDINNKESLINQLKNELSIKQSEIKSTDILVDIFTSHINENRQSINENKELISEISFVINENKNLMTELSEDILKNKKLIKNLTNELYLTQELSKKLILEVEHNRNIVAMNLNTTLQLNRKREEYKYILKYPLRLIKKSIGFIIHPKVTLEFYSDKRFIKRIGLIQKDYYIGLTNDYKIHKYNCVEHFLRYGWQCGFKPNEYYENDISQIMFSDGYYFHKDMYKTISKSPYFDEKYYRENNKDLPDGLNLVWHFIVYGWMEGRNPSDKFDVNYYLNNNSDILSLQINPLYHYIKFGYYEGRSAKDGSIETGFLYNLKVKKFRYDKATNNLSTKNIIDYIKKNGIKQSFNKANAILNNHTTNLIEYNYIAPILTDEITEELNNFKYCPKISIIIPVYNVEPKWLDLAIKSIENQWYTNWEICIVDDCSTNQKTKKYLENIKNDKILVKFLDENLHISGASNEALKMSTGEYIGLMDNDDEITVDALYEMVKKINNGYTFIYSDEDKLDMDGKFCEPHFKADFSKDMLNSQNYISHFTVIKKDHIVEVDGFTLGLEGAQDYDLYLKIFDLCEKELKVCHILKVLYHWRKIPGSTASEFSEKSYAQDSGKIALENSIKRKDIDAIVLNGKKPGTYRLKYNVIGNPKVSIIIPFKDGKNLLTKCIESILKSTYENFEIIGISNNSKEEDTFKEMKSLKNIDKRIHFYEYNVEFNYSKINNYAVKNYSTGDYIVLLNNDIEILTKDWMEEMLGFAQRDNTGAIGAKLYYPNNTIQHAGVIIGLGGVAGHSHKYFTRYDNGYFHRLNIIQNFSAVTAAFLMVNKKKFEEINGLNENELKVAFNDVDFCLRLQEKGYLNVFTPYVEAYHYESISRGAEDSPEKVVRFNSEVNFMLKRHKGILESGDPFYNVNLTLDREDFTLKSL